MTFVNQIRDLNSESILNAIYEIKNIFTSHQHNLTAIHVDNAKGIDNDYIRNSLNSKGVRLIFHTPGRHVRKAEITIKTVKQAFKTTIMGLSYPCPHKLYPFAIKFVV